METTDLQAIEQAITKQRLSRYLPAAGYDIQKAISIYLWNGKLCETFIVPLHVCEVVCRNSIQKTLRVRLKSPWYSQTTLHGLLDQKQLQALNSTIADEQHQHQARMNDDHIVSSLHFGFWDHLTTKRFDRLLWKNGIKHNFPNAYANNLTIRDVNARIQTVRQWRNRIAHHRAIFDKDPSRKFDETLELIRWSCADTADWVRKHSSFHEVLKSDPR